MSKEAPVVDDGDRRVEIRLAGSGGQGIGLAGLLLAEAAVLSGRNAAQSQVYGPESRGGASRSDVVIAEGEIGFPKATRLDVLVALTQEASERYCGGLLRDGLLLIDEGRVPRPPVGGWRCRPLPIEATAKRVGGAVATNMVALGALLELTRVVEPEALERAMAARVPARHRDLNLRALAAGRELVGSERGSR